MAHYLTFDSPVTCTVNGVSVSSGYELHDGDVIVASTTMMGMRFFVNTDPYSSDAIVDVYDSDVEVLARSESGGGAY